MKEYEELKGKCKDCYAGCSRLENPKFTGIERCEHYSEPPKKNN